MKKLFLIPVLIILVTTGCKKEPLIKAAPPAAQAPQATYTIPPPLNPLSNGPTVFAGFDIWVPLPVNVTVLDGYTSYLSTNIESYSWKKISGPSSYLIENPLSKETKVSNLEKGTYEFEFTVTTKAGLIDKDMVSIQVYDPRIAGANEFIFKNLQWICPMGCYVQIKNFDIYVLNDVAFKVYLKSANSANWIELFNNRGDKYSYGRINNNFTIFSDDPDNEDHPLDIKITF